MLPVPPMNRIFTRYILYSPVPMPYDHSTVEPKWQARWREAGLHKTPTDPAQAQVLRAGHVPLPVGRRPARRPPRGLHRHRHPLAARSGCRASTCCTRWAGTPSACRPRTTPSSTGVHPRVDHRAGHRQLPPPDRQSLGFAYDWDREVNTTDPGYCKWTQWIFLQLYETRPRLRGRRPDQLVPVVQDRPRQRGGQPGALRALRHAGRAQATCASGCCGSPRYADRLLEDLDELDWPESTLAMQRNWIGRSEGAEVDVQTRRRSRGASIRVFTTRPDTLFGATYMVLAPEHPLVDELTTPAQRAAVDRVPGRRRAARATSSAPSWPRRRPASFTGALRDQPGQRRADPDLDRRLRADELRHRRDHGGAGARRARLRVRAEVRPADHRRWSSPPTAATPDAGRGRSPATASRSTRARSTACRRPRPSRRSSPGSRSAASARARSTTTCATGCSPASATGASRSRSSTARQRRRRRRVPEDELPVRLPEVERLRADAARASRRWRAIDRLGEHHLPDVRRPGQARDQHDAAVGGLVLVLPALPRPEERRARLVDPARREALDAGRPLRRRRRARRAAPALRALLAQGAVRPGPRHHEGAVPEAAPPGDGAGVRVPGRDGPLPRARRDRVARRQGRPEGDRRDAEDRPSRRWPSRS